MTRKLSHIDTSGKASMVDVSLKEITTREALAKRRIIFPQLIYDKLKEQSFLSSKGSIIQTAVMSGIQAVKKTSELIPLCHPLSIAKIKIDITPSRGALNIVCEVKCNGRTGVEMEALTGVSVAALTIYDMCKSLSQDLQITNIQLMKKTGGKTDFKR